MKNNEVTRINGIRDCLRVSSAALTWLLSAVNLVFLKIFILSDCPVQWLGGKPGSEEHVARAAAKVIKSSHARHEHSWLQRSPPNVARFKTLVVESGCLDMQTGLFLSEWTLKSPTVLNGDEIMRR